MNSTSHLLHDQILGYNILQSSQIRALWTSAGSVSVDFPPSLSQHLCLHNHAICSPDQISPRPIMSHARGLLTPLMITVIGIGTGKMHLIPVHFQDPPANLLPGVAIFNPALKQDKEQKVPEQYVLSKPPSLTQGLLLSQKPAFSHRNVEIKEEPATPSPSPEEPPEQIRTTEEAVASPEGVNGIPKDAERWAKVQSGHFSKPVDTFNWSGVPLDRYSTPEKPS